MSPQHSPACGAEDHRGSPDPADQNTDGVIEGSGEWVPPELTRGERTRRFMKRAAAMEGAVYRSVWRWIRRGERVPPGAMGFSYHQPVMTVLIVLMVLSAVEIPILDLIFQRWWWIRLPVLLLSVWGLIWMLGLLLSFLTGPHSVGPAGIRVRNGLDPEIVLDWEIIASVVRAKHVAETSKDPKLIRDADGRGVALNLYLQLETNIEVALEHSITAPPPWDATPINVIRFYVENDLEFLQAARSYLTEWEANR